MITMTIKSNEYKTFALFHVSILQSYAILVTFKGFPVFEIRKNLDLRKILSTPKIFLKSRFHCIKFQKSIFLDRIIIFIKIKIILDVANSLCKSDLGTF